MASKKESSVPVLEERLSMSPGSLAFSRLADGYRKRGDISEAVRVCQQGISRHPEYITGHIILGRCFLEQENLKEAIQEFTKVCLLDRRNPIALKMLADVYSKQGMEEKAGDLYSYLLGMDPQNVSLVKLSKEFQGTGKTSVFEILGVERKSGEQALAEATREHRRPAEPPAEDLAATLDAVAQVPSTESEEGIETLETMQMDRGELMSAAGVETAPVDEVSPVEVAPVEEAPAVAETAPVEEKAAEDVSEMGSVTGDDISERVGAMFEEEEVEGIADVLDESAGADALSPESIESAETIEVSGSLLAKESAGVPGGDDIGSRIEELFGDESSEKAEEVVPAKADVEAEVDLALPETAAPETDEGVASAEVTSDDVASRIDEMFGKEEPDAGVAQAGEEIAEVSGEDVSSRIDEISGEELVEAGPPIDEVGAEITGEDVSSRIDEMVDGAVDVAPEAGDEVTGEDVSERIDEIADEEMPMEMVDEVQEEAQPADKAGTDVTGEDVSSRIEQMFPGETETEDEAREESVDAVAPTAELSDEGTLDLTSDVEDIFAEEEAEAPAAVDLETRQVKRGGLPPVAEADKDDKEDIDIFDDAANAETVILDRSVLGAGGPKAPVEDHDETVELGGTHVADEAGSRIDEFLADEEHGKMEDAAEPVALDSVADDLELVDETVVESPKADAEAAHPDDAEEGKLEPEEETDEWSSVDTIVTEEEEPRQDMPSGEDVARQLDHVLEGDVETDQSSAEDYVESTKEAEVILGEEGASDTKHVASQEAEDTIDLSVKDAAPAVEGDDVAKRLGQMFGDDPLATPELSESIPDDEEDNSAGEGFYNINGDDAQSSKSEVPEELDNVELEAPLEDDIPDVPEIPAKPGSELAESADASDALPVEEEESLEPVEDLGEVTSIPDDEEEESVSDEFYTVDGEPAQSSEEDQPEAETPVEEVAESPSVQADRSEEDSEATVAISVPTVDQPGAGKGVSGESEQEGEYSIPEHVLTPTLADIYYQQGQTQLAIQIYERILQRDGENEKIRERLEQIRAGVSPSQLQDRLTEPKSAKPSSSAKPKKGAARKRSSARKRPLEGVRIKKKFKERFKGKKPGK